MAPAMLPQSSQLQSRKPLPGYCCQSAIAKAVAGLNMLSSNMLEVFFVDKIQRQWLHAH